MVNDKPQLERFLALLGTELDLIKGYIDKFPSMIDVDSVDADYLPYIASLVGVEFNYDMPIQQQREEVKRAVGVWKQKGTLGGIERLVRTISGLETSVTEYAKNILVSNDLCHKSALVSDIVIAEKTRLPGDECSYSFDISDDGDYAWDKLAIFMQGETNKPLYRSMVQKLVRKMSEFLPVTTSAHLFLIDELLKEFYDNERFEDRYITDIEPSAVVEPNMVRTQWLWSNSQKNSNSCLGVSAYLVARGQRWYDEMYYS